jgi:hypothetical protein
MDQAAPRRTIARLWAARILLILAAIIMVAVLWWDHQGTLPSSEPETINPSVISLWTSGVERLIRFRVVPTDPESIMIIALFLYVTAYHLLILLLPWGVTLLSRSVQLIFFALFLTCVPVGLILLSVFFFGPTLAALPFITYFILPPIALLIIPNRVTHPIEPGQME